MFIDHVVVRVWGPEKVFKFYLSRCWEKGFISCHQHVTICSFERFFFSRWKDSSFPAPGWEDSLFPGAGSRSRRRVLPPGAGSPPGAGWSLPPFPVRGGSFPLLLAERPATAATYSMFVAELRASKSSFPSNGARVTRSALRFNNDTRILEIQGHERCISAMRWRIIKEQQRCWLLLAFRFRAYTPAPYFYGASCYVGSRRTPTLPFWKCMYIW